MWKKLKQGADWHIDTCSHAWRFISSFREFQLIKNESCVIYKTCDFSGLSADILHCSHCSRVVKPDDDEVRSYFAPCHHKPAKQVKDKE